MLGSSWSFELLSLAFFVNLMNVKGFELNEDLFNVLNNEEEITVFTETSKFVIFIRNVILSIRILNIRINSLHTKQSLINVVNCNSIALLSFQ